MAEQKAKIKALEKLFKNNYVAYITLFAGVLAMIFIANDFSFLPEKKQATVDGTYAEYLELKMGAILSKIEGVGAVEVMITTKEKVANDSRGSPVAVKDAVPEVDGVIVIAQGARNANIKQIIYDACVAALSAKPHKVQVFESKR